MPKPSKHGDFKEARGGEEQAAAVHVVFLMTCREGQHSFIEGRTPSPAMIEVLQRASVAR